jgi:Xaa-Pro aminopeptidase
LPREPLGALETILERLGLERGRVGFDETGIGHALRAERCADLVPVEAEPVFREIRLVKTPDEVTRLQKAALANEQAGREMYSACRPGAEWDRIVRQHAIALARRGGVQEFVSCAPGQESSMIFTLEGHGRRLTQGEWVRHDYGATCRSYWADTGRTVSLGPPSAILRRYYEACRRGLEAVEEQLQPGARSGDLFELAVQTVRKAGIPHYDRSHCGHCIGLELYDLGGIAPHSDLRLEAGMVLNVELPYYELGWGGLQIEDTFVITPGGARRLTHSDRELIVN